jgi:regulator of sirC expression with transglutaminase-like and TPR domain
LGQGQMPCRSLLFLCFFGLLAGTISASAFEKKNDGPIASLRDFLSEPESQIDFARAKLTFDKFSDPDISVSASLKEIDAMADTAGRLAGPNAPPLQRLAAIRRVIYVDGDWNGHHPFQYDLSDPLGRKPANRLLSTYLRTRRGNCISMPALFMALANKLDVHVTLSIAPEHEFVKYIDDTTGKAYNLETTSGGFPARDAWYRQNSTMTDQSIKSGLYLKTLTRKQSLAVMAEILVEHAMDMHDYRTAIALSDLILAQYPEFAWALIQRGIAYSGLIDSEFRLKYPEPIDIPQNLFPTYLAYVQHADESFNKIDALGWRQEDGKVRPNSAAK